jgi:O-succinylbenzoate synthase
LKIFFAKYKRKLKTPFRFGNQEIQFREGFIFKKEEGGGKSYSEAAPFLGHSVESLEEVENALEKMDSHEFLSMENPFASLLFAADSLNNSRILQAVPSNALFPIIDFSSALERYEILAEQGYTTFKIKIFPQNFSLVLEFLKNIEGSTNTFRLDANGSLLESHLKVLKDAVPHFRKNLIEYIEEPMANWQSPILENYPISLAIDESQKNLPEANELANTIIAKPTAIGGRRELSDFLEKHKNKKVVFTSCLETEIGRRSLIKLFSEQNPLLPSGLSVGNLFQENYLPDVPVFKNIPSHNPQEALWLASLQWREMP